MSDPTMALPAGKTCADCAHVARCTMLGCTSRTAAACDFAPSRFVEAYRAPERPKGEPCRCGPTRLRAVKAAPAPVPGTSPGDDRDTNTKEEA